MAYSRYAMEMKDGDNNIYGLMDEEAREQLSDLNSALDVVHDDLLGDYSIPQMQLGNVTIASDGTPTYKVRQYGAMTPQGTDAYLKAGQKVGLTSYSLSQSVSLKYSVALNDGTGKYPTGSGFQTYEYTIPTTGNYLIYIETVPTTNQQSASVMANLFYVKDESSIDYIARENSESIVDLNRTIGDFGYTIPQLVLGNIMFAQDGTPTYQVRDYGVITPQNSYCHFVAGTKLSLSSYSGVKFFVALKGQNGKFLVGSGWMTTGKYTIPQTGDYILNIQSVPTSTQSSIDALFSLFVVETETISEKIDEINGVLKYEFPERYGLNGIKVIETINNNWGQGVALMGDKVLGFKASSDGHAGHADIDIYNINDLTTRIGRFEHNTGHCASADYNADVDLLLIANGGSADTPTIYLVSNASTLQNNDSIEYNGDNVCALDVSQIAPNGVCGCFGENGDIVFVITSPANYDVDLTKTIYKLQLGYGTNDMTTLFPNASVGTYTAAADGVPNGTAKIWATYNVNFPGELQGLKYISGKLVIPMDSRVPTGIKTPFLVVVELFKNASKVVGTYWLPSLNKNGTQLAVESEDVFFDGAYGYVDVGSDKILKFEASQL